MHVYFIFMKVNMSERFDIAILGKRNLTSALRAANYNKLVSAGVTVLDGVGAFTSATDIVVTAGDGTKQTITAEKFIINTGAEPVMPKIPGLENNPSTLSDSPISKCLDR